MTTSRARRLGENQAKVNDGPAETAPSRDRRAWGGYAGPAGEEGPEAAPGGARSPAAERDCTGRTSQARRHTGTGSRIPSPAAQPPPARRLRRHGLGPRLPARGLPPRGYG